MDRIIPKIFLVATTILLVSACATSPGLVAKRYERAVVSKNATAVISMQEKNEISQGEMQQTLAEGNFGTPNSENQWEHQKSSTTIKVGTNNYLMVNEGNKWKIRCATIGPFHDKTPEMTLLLFLHHIKNYNENAIRRLVSSELKLQSEPFPAEFKQQLVDFSEEISSKSCNRFEIKENLAYLAYGSNKTLTLKKESEGWRVLDLW